MKKVVLSLAVLFSVALVSCGDSKKAAEAVDSESIAVVEEVAAEVAVDSIAPDSVAVDTIVEAAAAAVAE